MLIPFYLALLILFALSSIYFRLTDKKSAYGICKAITTSLIIAVSLMQHQDGESSYGWMITIALIFCLIGDIFLLKESTFVYGLGSFLVAHVVFTSAFSSLHGIQLNAILLIVLLLLGAAYFVFLSPSLKSLKIPVAIYFLAIIMMDWQAISLALNESPNSYQLLGIGAVLFTFSDAVIAFKKFKRDFKFSEVLILSTYWCAIFLFCMSIDQLAYIR